MISISLQCFLSFDLGISALSDYSIRLESMTPQSCIAIILELIDPMLERRFSRIGKLQGVSETDHLHEIPCSLNLYNQ